MCITAVSTRKTSDTSALASFPRCQGQERKEDGGIVSDGGDYRAMGTKGRWAPKPDTSAEKDLSRKKWGGAGSRTEAPSGCQGRTVITPSVLARVHATRGATLQDTGWRESEKLFCLCNSSVNLTLF